MASGNIPHKTAAQRERIRARSAVRRHGMNHKPATKTKGRPSNGR